MSPTSYQAAPPRGTVDSRCDERLQASSDTSSSNSAHPVAFCRLLRAFSPSKRLASTEPPDELLRRFRVSAAPEPRLVKPKLGPVRVVRRVAGGLVTPVAPRPVATDQHVRPGVGVLARPHDPLLDVSRKVVHAPRRLAALL